MRYKHPESLKRLGITKAIFNKMNARRIELINKDYKKDFKGLTLKERKEFEALQNFTGWVLYEMFPLPTID